MPDWTITGEAGRSLDASSKTLAEMDVKAAAVTLRSLGTDTFTFVQEVDANTAAAYIPEQVQRISLYRNGGLFFTGIATSVRETVTAGSSLITTTVSGPWWYAENIALTALVTPPAGSANERQTFQYGTQNLTTSIENTILRAAALGVPWQLGTVSSFFQFPQITLNQQTCAQAITELVRMCPDAMTWVDYSSSPPTINVTRRGVAATKTITIGGDDVTAYDVNPVHQLQVTQVKIPFAGRANTGRRNHQIQSAGSYSAGKVQVLTVSGPELDTYIPPDRPTESVVIKTISTSASDSALTAMAVEEIQDLARLGATYGANWYTTTAVGSYTIRGEIGKNDVVKLYDSSSGSSSFNFTATAPTFLDSNKNPVSGHFVYPSVRIPDWLAGQLGGTKVSYSFMFYVVFAWDSVDHPNGQPNVPSVLDFASGAGGFENRFTQTTPYSRVSVFFKTYTGEGLVLPSSYNNVTFYRPPDYYFVAPPSGFADNMLAAQNWLPYEGRIDIFSDFIGLDRYTGKKVDLVGTRTGAHQTMGALVESETLDLMSGITTVNLGSPPRIDYRSLLEKVRRTPQDNILVAS